MGISISLVDRPIARPSLLFPLDGSSGAVVEFFGVVRGREAGKAIAALDYEAYRAMARKELERIAAETARREGCHDLVLIHRVGIVPVGEPSLYLRVAAERRGAAFRIAEELIQKLKADVPIWKAPVPSRLPAASPPGERR
ncbi:Molybdopterin converting factor, large subunit [Methylacidimicrobium sp. AP8]|uniref:molybdopterin synthase catalytic subunit n=1 Tax=Methylacidimicrobium sp. AP8 TaxID=2730359 RepID=UPI0018BFAE90|nr:molybdenum cofactor biosynthesis protein MoaE [Methylacidimicrobium sp. AP8]CAB4244261.1 Molybdopterin converting factor, large subunit [Methylacidimicrobium sp. AP8]